MRKILLWLRIIRPQTLFASLVPTLLGLLFVSRCGSHVVAHHPVLAGALTVVCALSLQILSNLINDYYDYLRGSDKAGRAGFRRALAEGEVTKRQMLCACLLALAVALCTGFYLVLVGGWPILAVGVSAIIFAWLYTATSHSLSYLGIADIFVLLYYGVVASTGTVWIQTHSFCSTAFWAGAVSGLISMGVLMINNLRDIDDDRAAGKKTLPVRFGKRAGEVIMLCEVLLMPACAFLAFGLSVPMLIIIPAGALWLAVLKARGAAYNKCLLATGFVNLIYLLLCVLQVSCSF